MSILITGANGYLGRGIVKKLLDDKEEVIATDFDDTMMDKRANKIKADLFSIEDPYDFFNKPDIILHLAWRDGFVHNSMNHILDLPKHIQFLEKMAAGGARLISAMGSMHEVGFYEGSINENTVCHPQSYYGIAKDALRNSVAFITKRNKIKMQWLRGFYIVGTSEQGSSIFSKIVQANIAGKKEFPFTLGQNQFDFIEYEKFCEQVAATVEQDKINGIINICSGRPEKLADCVERFIKENGYDIELKYGAFPDRPYDSKAIWGDSSKIEKILKARNDNLDNEKLKHRSDL